MNPNVYQVARSYTIPVTFAIFVFGVVYQFLLAWDSLRSKNNIQLFAQAVCNVCLFISAVLQYEQVKDVVHGLPPNHDAQNKPLVKLDVNIWAQIHPALIAFIAVFAACSVAMCGLAYKLHKQFAWALYKDINADTSLRTRYLIYQVTLSGPPDRSPCSLAPGILGPDETVLLLPRFFRHHLRLRRCAL